MAASAVCQSSGFWRGNGLRIIMLIWCSGSAVRCGQSSSRVVTGGNVTARVGEDATFRCEVPGAHVETVEWSHCDQEGAPQKLLVFHASTSRLSPSPTHKERVVMTTASSFTLRSVRREDYGAYCCKVNVFPDGVLEEAVYLTEAQEAPPNTPPKHTILGFPPQIIYILGGVGGAILLVVIVATVIICKKRRGWVPDYVNVAMHHGRPLSGQDAGGDKSEVKGADEEEEEEDDEEGLDYLNVPACLDS
ncbi:hypothetical protein ACEWY4_009143 [Coilia grayii]|uniref:Ig-like domain-containing protein n=1 Tax=Coilia grayii TaxID=363190 RepID=A0ABD1K5L1_9TELE